MKFSTGRCAGSPKKPAKLLRYPVYVIRRDVSVRMSTVIDGRSLRCLLTKGTYGREVEQSLRVATSPQEWPGTNFKSPPLDLAPFGGRFGSVSVIGAASNSEVQWIPAAFRPIGIAVHPEGSRVYVVHDSLFGLSDIVSVIVIPSLRLSWSETHNSIAVHPDGIRIYVTNNQSSDALSVIDTTSNSVIDTVVLPRRPTQGLVPEVRRIQVPMDKNDENARRSYNRAGAKGVRCTGL